MLRFAFRLENVLKVRKKTEEGIEKKFSQRKAELLKVENEIRELRTKLHSFMKENQYSKGIFTVFDIIAVDNYISRIDRSIKVLKVLRSEKEIEVERVRALLKEAKKARKVIENLKERQWTTYLEQMNKEENIELDDINHNVHLNKEKLTIEDVPIEDM